MSVGQTTFSFDNWNILFFCQFWHEFILAYDTEFDFLFILFWYGTSHNQIDKIFMLNIIHCLFNSWKPMSITKISLTALFILVNVITLTDFCWFAIITIILIEIFIIIIRARIRLNVHLVLNHNILRQSWLSLLNFKRR